MPEKIVGKKCKNMNNAPIGKNMPLKKIQLHYTVLDAIICISINKI